MSTVKPYNTAVKFGLIGGFILMIVSLIFFIIEQPDSKIPQYIGYAVIILVVVLGIQEYKNKSLGGYLQLSQGIGVGTLIGLVVGVVSAIWFIIYVNAIDTGFTERIMQVSIEQMEEQGLSDEQIEQSMGIAGIFMSPVVFSVMAIIMYTILGLIISLLVSLILRKDKPLV